MPVIPKKLHYCWFGRHSMPDLAVRCMESWREYLSGYETVLWNEDSFDLGGIKFVKEAYECGKFAFVSDYVRLSALYDYGGIYLDTDVEIINNIDEFLVHPAFSGFENPHFIPTGIIGATAGHPWIGRFLEYYKDRSFYREDGSMDLTANVIFMSRISEQEFGFKRDNTMQVLKGDVYIYPNDYFCPMVWETRAIHMTKNTHAIHHFAGAKCRHIVPVYWNWSCQFVQGQCHLSEVCKILSCA